MTTTSEKRRGALIVLEGVDRSGKSTQCKLLAQTLVNSGINAVLKRFPDRTTTIGTLINSYLTTPAAMNDRVIHLLFAANRWEAMSELKKLLESGVTVVLDRYAFSGVAFSRAKGLPLDWCKSPDRGLITPDLVLFFDLPIEEAMKRDGFGEERYETLDMQTRVREAFWELIRADLTAADSTPWKIMDASKPVDEVQREVIKEAMDVIQNLPESFHKALWILE